MTEYESIREKTAEILYWLSHQGRSDVFIWQECSNKKHFYDVADQILSLDGIEIKSKDQSLPEIPFYVGKVVSGAETYYEQGQRSMLKSDSEGKIWVKVIPKGR